VEVVLLSGALCQELRLEAFRKFQKEKVPILVATDLGARGLDYEHVNFIINYECPPDLATYIHRMGRSGRFGTLGRVVTLLGYGTELATLNRFQLKVSLNISLMQSLEDVKTMASTPPTQDELIKKARKSRFTPVTVPNGRTLLSFGEAIEFLEKGGKEAADFAITYCVRSTFVDEDIDPDHLRKLFDQFILDNRKAKKEKETADENEIKQPD